MAANAAPGDTVADRVFGQSSFTSNTCNLGGPSAGTLCFAAGVAVDRAGNVYVADASNNRVLEYDAPLATDTIADRVFGQADSFIYSGCSDGSTGLCRPIDVAADD